VIPLDRYLVGGSYAMRALRETIRRVAPSPVPALILGPRGAGKELVAHAVHELSGRAGPMVAFNACAIADSMFEDALFGHVRGAFTGALADAPGYLAEADRGTAFFDEVSGISLANQTKLLRAFETRAFRPVGGVRDRRSDFRLLSATNEDLTALVRSGRFRADLADRVSVCVLHVPPLRERLEDLPALIAHLVSQIIPSRPLAMSASAQRAFAHHDWPGNVRELKHVLERIALATDGVVTRATVEAVLITDRRVDREVTRQEFERRRLLGVVESLEWDIGAIAAHFGIHPATVYRRLQRLRIEGLPKGTEAIGTHSPRNR
jgi:DNA-binding NtrC family response regulator